MTGDGLVADFASTVKAMQCAIDIQNKLNKDNTGLPQTNQIAYRVGLNLGDVIIEGDDIFGEGVNVGCPTGSHGASRRDLYIRSTF